MSRDFLESLSEVDGLDMLPDDHPLYQNAPYVISFVSGRFKPLGEDEAVSDTSKASNDTADAGACPPRPRCARKKMTP